MYILRRMRHNKFAVNETIAAYFRREAAGKGEFAAMKSKGIKFVVPLALAALLLTGCSFRDNDDTGSGGQSALESDVMSNYPYSSNMSDVESDWGDTYSSVLSDGNSLASDIQSGLMPDRNESSSGHASR